MPVPFRGNRNTTRNTTFLIVFICKVISEGSLFLNNNLISSKFPGNSSNRVCEEYYFGLFFYSVATDISSKDNEN